MESGASEAYLLLHTAAILGRQADQVLRERLGIGLSQYRILTLLQERPGLRQRKLADHLGQTEASISRQVKLMHEKGFLAVSVNPKSRREHVTLLTAKGAKITEAARDALATQDEAMINLLSEKQRTYLGDVLNIFHGHICAPGKPYACDHLQKQFVAGAPPRTIET